jgi:tetratricopeptide (TPR) repeat protein
MSGRPKRRKGASQPAVVITRSAPFARKHGFIFGALLVAATILVYQKAWHAGYIWDDDVYVTTNKLLTAPDGLRRIWFSLDSPSQYFPLVYTTFRLEHALWGLNSAGYHWVNILLHAANALLLWRLLRSLEGPGAWLAAAIFALHPVHVESVAWITERKNVLMGFFFLLALLAWTAFIADRPGKKWNFYALALVCYALALFSKTTACTLPAALLLILWLRGTAITWRRIVQVAPFVVLGICMGLVSIWWERYHQGTRGDAFAIGMIERVLVASRAVWFYAGKLIWPANLSFSYPKWPISVANPLDYIWLLITAGAGVAIYLGRRRVGRSIEVGALFFVATLSPMLGFIMLYTFRFSFVADHYQYPASIGPIALAAVGINALGRWEKGSPFLMPGLSAAILLSLGLLTWRQCAMYQNLETLWRTTIARNPTSWMAHNNLGTALLNTERVEEAIVEFINAVKLQPDYAAGHNNLGNAYLRLGRTDDSLRHLRRAIEIDPRYPEARNNLGNTLLQMGRQNEAAAEYNKAIEIDPRYAEAHNNLGALFLQMGRVDDAMAHLQKALELTADNASVHNNLGNALLRRGQLDEALLHYDKALALRPNDVQAQNNLAWLLATCPENHIRNGPRAVELAERADRQTRGQNPVIVATLSAAYAESGRFPEALRTAQRALDLATAAGNAALAEVIRGQVQLYQSGSPSRDPELQPKARPSS